MKKKAIFLLVVLCVLLIGVLSVTAFSISSKTASAGTYSVWYVSTDDSESMFGTEDYVYSTYSDISDAFLHTLLNRLMSQPKNDGLKSAFAPDITVQSLSLSNNVLTIDFSSQFLEMSRYEISLAEYCIAQTFYGLNSISEIAVCVGGKPMTGTNITKISATDFITDFSDLIPSSVSLSVYTLSPDGESLVKEIRTFTWYPYQSLPETVLDYLLTTKAGGAIPTGTKVTSCSQDNSVLYVEFSDEFALRRDKDGRLALYSVVNTLASIPSVTYVNVSLEGEAFDGFDQELGENLLPDYSFVSSTYNKGGSNEIS